MHHPHLAGPTRQGTRILEREPKRKLSRYILSNSFLIQGYRSGTCTWGGINLRTWDRRSSPTHFGACRRYPLAGTAARHSRHEGSGQSLHFCTSLAKEKGQEKENNYLMNPGEEKNSSIVFYSRKIIPWHLSLRL